MGLKDLWENFKNKLGSKSEEPIYFGAKSFQFTLQSNDGFQMEVDSQTAFQSLRLRSVIKENGYDDPFGPSFEEPIVLSGIKRGKHLQLIMKWASEFLKKESLQKEPIRLRCCFKNNRILGPITVKELKDLREVADYLDIPLVMQFLQEFTQRVDKWRTETKEMSETVSIETLVMMIIEKVSTDVGLSD